MLQTLHRQPDDRTGSAKNYRVTLGLIWHFPKPFYPMENEDCEGEIPASLGRGINSFKWIWQQKQCDNKKEELLRLSVSGVIFPKHS